MLFYLGGPVQASWQSGLPHPFHCPRCILAWTALVTLGPWAQTCPLSNSPWGLHMLGNMYMHRYRYRYMYMYMSSRAKVCCSCTHQKLLSGAQPHFHLLEAFGIHPSYWRAPHASLWFVYPMISLWACAPLAVHPLVLGDVYWRLGIHATAPVSVVDCWTACGYRLRHLVAVATHVTLVSSVMIHAICLEN
jgi:hypothetical protein